MPDRFDLAYIAEDGTKKRALVVHRSSIGAIERIMAFLIEHYAGNFPLWLSPSQIAIIPVAEVHNEYASEIHKALLAAGFRAEIDTSNDSMGKKVRSAKKERLPYFLVLGDKDIESKTVTVESRDTDESESMSVSELIQKLTEEASV